MRLFWGDYSRIGLLWASVVFAIDQASKYWLVQVYQLAEKGVVTITSFFDLVMVWNEGISYGLFQQTSFGGQVLLICLAFIVTIALVVWLARSDSLIAAISLGLVIGGAIGNGIDRVIYGAVADFASFHVKDFYWYVFNVADVAIVAGVIGLMYDAVFPSRKKVSNVS